MSWSLQKINNGAVLSRPGAVEDIGYEVFVCVYNDQQHFTYRDANGNIQDAWWGGNRWHLQKINNGGMTPGPLAAGGLFVCVYNDQQHFAYLDGSGNIQDCWYDGSGNWNLQQINNGTGPTAPGEYVATDGPAAAGDLFVSVYNDQQHFTYRDANGNLQDCWYDGSGNWNLQQINNANGSGATVPGEYIATSQATAPAAGGVFVCPYNDQQHFAYLDGSGNIQDCWYDGSGNWNLQQINNGTGPTAPGEYVATDGPAAAGDLFVSVYNDQQHFTYRDANGNLQDCWYDGSGNWNLQQINNANGSGATVPGEYIATSQATAPAAGGVFVCPYNDQQHFAYLDGSGNIQDCWYDGSGNWNLQQINNGGMTPGPSAAGGAFVCVYNRQQHFAYRDADGNIWDSWWDPEDLHLVQRRELGELVYYLNDTESLGVLLLGAPWSGKTTLLRMVEEVLKKQGRAVFFVSFLGLRYPGELGGQVLDAIAASPFKEADDDIGRTLRTSTGAPALSEAAAILRRVGARLPSPVLLFDGLDESVDPPRMAAAVEELSLALDGWKLVVSSRPEAVAEIGRFARFEVVQLRNLTEEDAAALLREDAPGLPEAVIPRIADLARGNPLLLQFMVREFQRSGSLAAITDVPSLGSVLERLVNEAVRTSSNPAKLSELLEDLALAGGRDRITTLASKSRITEEEVRRLLDAPDVLALVVLDNLAETVALLHDAVRDVIVSGILTPSFRLADLKFGAEEAEKDELLDESFVPRRGMEAIFDMRRSIIVGDRGSGKSAIFRKLTAGTSAVPHDRQVDIFPVANTGDLLHRIVEKDAWLDADALRAAWIVVVAAVVASAVPASAPKKLRRNATDLRAAFGLPTEQASLIRRALPAAFRLLGGTTLKFAVGPVNLEAQLPSGSGGRPGKASVDVESFLKEADDLLGESARRVVVMFDRIDEIFKYDRTKQEAVVQALLQAEGHVSLFEHIGLVVFLRTDIFELYDIQEKNKLISRTLTLDWSAEEWLQVLVRRVLVNEPFQRLAERLHADDGTIETRPALEVLFPPEVEGQPVDQWLIDSLSNGNGDISPRLAVLLLYLTRELSARPEDVVSTLPLFTAEAVGRAMTKLSDLSYSEIVDDFKVATSFVLNIRAGKLDSFDLHKVEKLFNEAEGNISEQVRLLERLGFLERVVQETGSGAKSLFRIPKLYTRCWDYA